MIFKQAIRGLSAAALVAAVSTTSHASIIQIQLGGIDLTYDGTDITTVGGDVASDELTNATFLEDGAVVGVVSTDVVLGALIPGVLGISAAGDSVDSAAGGHFTLGFGGSADPGFLILSLESVTVNYLDLGVIQFALGASLASADFQDLPFDLVIGDEVSVSFSTQTSSFTIDSGEIASFVASGTGEIVEVPEPASLALFGLGTLAVAGRRRK